MDGREYEVVGAGVGPRVARRSIFGVLVAFGEAGNAEDRSGVQVASADRAGDQGVPERGGVDALAAVQE
ncbi:hypothetical protein [Streptomyces sp. NPDC060022]|uniref:hypothetical protein n=1 Tax=Streptomyces sp. NPDC060022 TaxID=3347039 RepID=UPI003695068C